MRAILELESGVRLRSPKVLKELQLRGGLYQVPGFFDVGHMRLQRHLYKGSRPLCCRRAYRQHGYKQMRILCTLHQCEARRRQCPASRRNSGGAHFHLDCSHVGLLG